MSNHVVFITDHAARGFLEPLPGIIGDCQPEFAFSVIDDALADSLSEETAPLEVRSALSEVSVRKSALALRDEDFLLAFADRPLCSTEHFLTNLFLAGSNLAERPPRVGIVSTTFIRRNILPSDPMYLTQRHAFYHLVVCALLGGFLDMTAHADRGCLMDFNNVLPDIRRKIEIGYSFCDECAAVVRSHPVGDSMFRICSALKARGSLDVAGIHKPFNLDFRSMNTCGHKSQAESFEALCAELYARSYGPEAVNHIAAPDGGVDLLVRRGSQRFGIQCKFFVDDFAAAQVRQIEESYRSARSKYTDLAGYFVLLPRLLTKRQREGVLDLEAAEGPPLSIVDRDSLASMVSRELDLARRYFG